MVNANCERNNRKVRLKKRDSRFQPYDYFDLSALLDLMIAN